jgi:hypothetical protein
MFRYREPKPRSNFGIGIGAETFLSETEFFFSKEFKYLSSFPTSWGDIDFCKLEKKSINV